MPTETPKQRFLQNQQAVRWLQEVIVHSFFTSATDAAMLMMQEKLRKMENPPQPSEAYHRLLGAQQFLEELKNVCEVPEPRKQTLPNDNLIH